MTDSIENKVDNIGIGPQTAFYRGNKALPTANVQFEWTPHMVKEVTKCKNNLLYFGSNYFWAVTVEDGKQKLKLYKPQKKLLKLLEKERFVVTLASRQVGKSTTMTIFALWMTAFQEDKRVLIVANREDTAIELLRRIKFAYEMLPNWLKPGVETWGQTSVYFSNGSSIEISATSSTAARGKSINCLIIDEMAHIPDFIMTDFWESVIPIISSGKTTKIFAVSTPKGTNNLFYKTYTAAESGELKMWKSFRIDWWEIPGRDEKWKETMKEVMIRQNRSWAQEFENSFIDDGESAADAEVIDKMRKIARNPLYTYDDEHYKVWLEPNPEHIYAIGIDVADGIGGCASVAQIIDITDLTNIHQAAIFHDASMEPYHFAEYVNKLANQWGNPPLLIESNGPGGQVIDPLRKVHKYYNIVEYVSENQKSSGRLGIYSHINSKNKAVTNMRYWINSLKVVNIYDMATIHELETFVRHPNGTWKKKSGEHIYDDRVHALLWALFVLHEELVGKYFEVIQYDTRGKPLKIKSLDDYNKGEYKLDPYYNDQEAHMPIHFNYYGNSEIDQLVDDGWEVWQNTPWKGDFFDK